jgi:SAM-dependent methyltransferase
MSVSVDQREVLAERLVGQLVGAFEVLCVYVGVELGLYAHLRASMTAPELAKAADIAPRYAREWLEQQYAAEIVECEDPTLVEDSRRFVLSPEHAEVLTDTDSAFYLGAHSMQLAGIVQVIPALLQAFRDGSGVPYSAYGKELRRGIAAGNRPMFLHELGSSWLPSMPDVDERLRSLPSASVLDLGCGLGASSLALARSYPYVRVVGVDLDEASIEEATAAAAKAGLADRVTFVAGSAVGMPAGPFELVTIFEALHDMGDPVAALRAARSVLAPGGSVLVADERVADTFGPGADLVERLNYGFSVLHCLPATIAESPVEANGTVLRAPTMQRWATSAGFGTIEILPIENDFWRFYRLRVG